MAAKKEKIHFNQYFPTLWQYAQSRGLNKGEWMIKSGVGRQRFTEFIWGWTASKSGTKSDKSARNLTASYFLKLLSPLQITPEEVESMSGIKFTKEQKYKLRLDAWMRSQEKELEIAMANPEKWELCKSILKLDEKPKD